jgi:serine phosphatase RsbU (regulator of sigma subunit)
MTSCWRGSKKCWGLENAVDQRPTILIVDDEPFNLDTLEQELDDLGYAAIPAANGQEALNVLASEAPDMVLLDIMMPVMDGFEVLRRLKAEPEWRNIPVVIVSALSDMDSVVRGIKLGADDYLPKPFDPVLLAARLQAGLARKQLHDLEKRYLQSLQRELTIGHQIQVDFLPKSLPELPGWELAAYFKAARDVAGDFYDAFPLPDGRTAFFLGDVTDKGVGAALFMALYRTLLRAFLGTPVFINAEKWKDNPGECLRQVVEYINHYVVETHDDALFASLVVGVLTHETGCIVYINAGHNPPRILRAGAVVQHLPPSGPLLGAMDDAEYTAGIVNLLPGDLLLIFSDGLEDAVNPREDIFGIERLLAAACKPADSAQGMLRQIMAEIEAFMDGEPQYDDFTALAVKRSVGS